MRFIFNFKKLIAAVGIALVFAGVFYAAASFKGFQDTVVREIRETHEETERLSRNFQFLAQDSNEARTALGLAPRDYSDTETDSAPAGEEGDVRVGAALVPYYQAVELLAAQMQKNARNREFAAVFAEDSIKAIQKKNAYTLRQEAGILRWEKGGKPWFSFSPDTGKPGFEVTSFRGTSFSFQAADAGLLGFLETESAALASHLKNLEPLPALFRAAFRDEAVTAALESRGLVIEPFADTEEEISARIGAARERSASKIRLALDKRTGAFFIGEKTFPDITSFRSALLSAVKTLDVRSMDQVIVEENKKLLEELFQDPGFAAYLATKNLTLSRQPNEDEEYVYYDFLTPEGSRAGSLGIQKKIGEIYLFDDEYVSLGSLKTIGLQKNQAPGEAKKKLNLEDLSAQDSSARTEGNIHTILLAGAHERMTDTLILANINEATGAIDLVSLPRDLFYRNRKINAIYYRYGAQRLVEEISGLTGLDIENYVIIDMFAFIDAINILGGIDITLSEALVDPTYRVRDNGRWATLFYAAGTHHLGGVEALRVARSRHFTSDFGRSRRQQDILAAIKENISGLGVSDMGKVYELARVLIKYVETSFTPYELVNYFIKYRSAKIKSQTVLTTDNILYHSYTNLRHMNLKEEEVEADFDKGAYILLPLNDDWSLVRRFIRSCMEGPAA